MCINHTVSFWNSNIALQLTPLTPSILLVWAAQRSTDLMQHRFMAGKWRYKLAVSVPPRFQHEDAEMTHFWLQHNNIPCFCYELTRIFLILLDDHVAFAYAPAQISVLRMFHGCRHQCHQHRHKSGYLIALL